MDDEKLVSAEKARELLSDQVECFIGYAQIAPSGCLCGPVSDLPDGSWLVALARTVIALHARAERAERERDAARVFLDAEIGANVRWAAQAERDLLRRLWQRIDGEQDGDAPSAAEMEDGLVRLFHDMRAKEEGERVPEVEDRGPCPRDCGGRIEAADGHIHCPTCGLEQPDTAPVEAPEDAGGDGCGQCFTCLDRPDLGLRNPTSQRMVLCPECGNKRCPKATHHGHDCTGSNRPGQPGSRYGGRPSQPPADPECLLALLGTRVMHMAWVDEGCVICVQTDDGDAVEVCAANLGRACIAAAEALGRWPGGGTE